MSLPRYPKYKDSKVVRLGAVPEHWEVKRLKYGLSLLTEKSERQMHQVALENVEGWTGRFVPTETDFEGDGVEFKSGDILFGKLRPYLAKVHLADRDGEAVGDFHVLRPERAVVGRFAQYQMLTRQFIDVVDGSTFGSRMPRASWDFLASLDLVLPPAAEQQAIVAFLDRETAKIDALVVEQQRLVELLKEKRQAVVSHAVTKGLNPAVPMKQSGIEWLGDVPAHWDIVRLKYAIGPVEQGWSPQCESEPAEEGAWGVLKVGCVNGHQFDASEQKALPETLSPPEPYEVHAGDILVSRGNTRELVGMASFIEGVRSRLLLSDLLYRFRAKQGIADGGFLALSLRAHTGRFQIEREAIGSSASMKKISQGTLREITIGLPPLGEQRAIAGWLSQENSRIDTLTGEALRGIALLKERRAALISAAVTGQIDVRSTAVEQPT